MQEIRRKELYVKSIIGELEAYNQELFEDWDESQVDKAFDLLDNVHNHVKAIDAIAVSRKSLDVLVKELKFNIVGKY